MRNKTIFKGSIAATTAAMLVAGILGTPARAADPVTITIWTFGDVIQRQLVQEYKNLHPEISLQIKKSDLDPLNGANMVTACTSKTGPDIVAVEVQYSGYWRSYPKCFMDLRKMKTSDANVVAGFFVRDENTRTGLAGLDGFHAVFGVHQDGAGVLSQNFGDTGFKVAEILCCGSTILAASLGNCLLQGTALICCSSGDDAIAV